MVLSLVQAQVDDGRASHLRSKPSCFHRTSISWIICRVSMSWRRSVQPPPGRKGMSFWWVLQSQPCPGPRVPRLCVFVSSPSRRSAPGPHCKVPPPRVARQGEGKPRPQRVPGRGPACSPSPFLKMMPTVPSLPASSLLYRTHRGFILESMKVHCSTLPDETAVSSGPSSGPGGRGGGGEAPAGAWGSPDFSQQGAGVERGLQVGEGLQVGLLAHAQVHQLLGLGLGGLLGAHFDDVVQGFQLAQRFPLARRMGGQRGPAGRGRLRASAWPTRLYRGWGNSAPKQSPGRGAGAPSLTCFISTFM